MKVKNFLIAMLENFEEGNLENVNEIDSSGIQLMVSFKKTAEGKSRHVSFEGHTEAVIDLFDVFDIAAYFGDPIVMGSKSEQ